ncbi:helix-turn-helix domain-containing protein [Lactococcus nasutitermitis]|uniref:Helix-turn-helix domain-containing protein n=1 Tax=Lactococcus nasutitermitis TaxID=1652957 RepID=A0ABV9JHT9_9LACT|nr:helix-turn-helix transcriptional regulator [Lactococcus nasutitermitis]
MKDDKQTAIIAQNIKKYLIENKMLQKELATRVGIAPSTLTDYLKLRSRPSHTVVKLMADVFGVEKSDIDTTYKVESSKNLECLISEAQFFEGHPLGNNDKAVIEHLIRSYFENKNRI